MGVNAVSRRGSGLEALLKVSNKLGSAEAKFVAAKRAPGASKRKILQGLWATLMGVTMFIVWKHVSNSNASDSGLGDGEKAWLEDEWGDATEGGWHIPTAATTHQTFEGVDESRGARHLPPYSNSNSSPLEALLHGNGDVGDEEEEGLVQGRGAELEERKPHLSADQGMWLKSKAGFRATGRSGGLANSGWSRLPRLRDGRDWREAIDGEDDEELEERDALVHNLTLPPRGNPGATNHTAQTTDAEGGAVARSGSLPTRRAEPADANASDSPPGISSPPVPRHHAASASAADSAAEAPRATMRFAEAGSGTSERRRVKIKLPDGQRMSGRLLTEGAPGGFGVMVKIIKDAATGRDQVVIVKIPYVAPAEAPPLPPGGVRRPPSTPRGVGMGQLEFEHFAAATLRSAALCAFVVKYDNLVQCPSWIQLGECSRNPSFMMLNCAASCCSLTKPHNKQQRNDAAHQNMKGLQPLHAHPLDHQPEVKTAESIVAETKAMSHELQQRASERSNVLERSGHKDLHPSKLENSDEEVKESGPKAQMRYQIDRQRTVQKNMQILTATALEAMKHENETQMRNFPNAKVHQADDLNDKQQSLSLVIAANASYLHHTDPERNRVDNTSDVGAEEFKVLDKGKEIESDIAHRQNPPITQVMAPNTKFDTRADGIVDGIEKDTKDLQALDSYLPLTIAVLDTAGKYEENVSGVENSSAPTSKLDASDKPVEGVESAEGVEAVDVEGEGISPVYQEAQVVQAGRFTMPNMTDGTSLNVDIRAEMSTIDASRNYREFGSATGQLESSQDIDVRGKSISKEIGAGETRDAEASGDAGPESAVIQQLDARQKEYRHRAEYVVRQKVEQGFDDFDA